MKNSKKLKEEKVEWKKLEEICKFQNGFAFPSNLFSSTGIPVIKINNISEGKVNFNNCKCFKSETLGINLEEYKIFPNDILITMTGATKIGYNYSENIGYLNQRVGKIIPFPEKIKDRFLFHLLSFFENKIYKLATGAGPRPNLSTEQIKSFKIPLPPLKKQEEIAAALDKFTELTEELTAREAQYDYYSNMLLSQEWIEKEEGKEVKWKKLEEVCKISTGKLNANAKTENGKYPFFTCNEIPSKINTYSFNTTAILLSGNGSKVGHINLYSGKFDAYQRTYVIELSEKNIDIKFLYYFFKTFIKTYIDKNKIPCSIPYITLPILQNFTISFPSLKTQQKIVNILDSFETLVKDIKQGLPREIELRQKQYEYYREKLLTF